MDANKYLQTYVTNKKGYQLTEEDNKKVQIQGVYQFVYDKLNSSKYRASKMPEELDSKVKQKIKYCLTNSLPIHISVPFGGYKKWQFPTYPNPDWSEVFAISLLIEYLSPVAAGYEKGVVLEFFSDEIFIARMNNYPQGDLDSYNDQFANLVSWFNRCIPKNFVLKSSKIRDQISAKELNKRFDNEIVKLRKTWDSLPEKEKAYRLAKSERNYQGNLSKLNKDESKKILLESTMVHDAFIFGDWENGVPWAFDKDMIAIGYRYTGTWGIPLRSSRSSTVQFWIGLGALINKNISFVPTSLSYNQYLDNIKNLSHKKITIFPKYFTNLQSIPVLKGK